MSKNTEESNLLNQEENKIVGNIDGEAIPENFAEIPSSESKSEFRVENNEENVAFKDITKITPPKPVL